MKSTEMTFACKKCKKCFRKNAEEFEESDEYCPHCDNHFVIDAKTPEARLEVEGEDVRVDSRYGTSRTSHVKYDQSSLVTQNAQGRACPENRPEVHLGHQRLGQTWLGRLKITRIGRYYKVHGAAFTYNLLGRGVSSAFADNILDVRRAAS